MTTKNANNIPAGAYMAYNYEPGTIVSGYRVFFNLSERGSSTLMYLTDSYDKAQELASQPKGWWGSKGRVQEGKMLHIAERKWIPYSESSVYTEHTEESMKEDLIASALAKLSPEEVEALGVKPPKKA